MGRGRNGGIVLGPLLPRVTDLLSGDYWMPGLVLIAGAAGWAASKKHQHPVPALASSNHYPARANARFSTAIDSPEYATRMIRSNSGDASTVSVTAICAAASAGYPYAPVLIAGNAMERQPFSNASASALL